MKIRIKQINSFLYYDSKNYWIKDGNEMLGYCKELDSTYPHIRKPLTDFEFLEYIDGNMIDPLTASKVIRESYLEDGG